MLDAAHWFISFLSFMWLVSLTCNILTNGRGFSGRVAILRSFIHVTLALPSANGGSMGGWVGGLGD